ncbi:electron transfer flavoprotein subunit alpha/FixB family protein [candidate division KSB1 bacterium]
MSKRVAFFIETREGKIRSVSFETATVARRLAAETGGSPVGIAVGSSIGALDEFGEYGIPEIIKIEHDTFNYYTSEGYTAAVCDTIGKTAPGILIITGSAMGKDLAPRIAARLDTEVIPDIIDVTVVDGTLEVKRPVFAGKAHLTVTSRSPLQFIVLRPKVFTPSKESPAACNISDSDFDAGSVKVRARVKEVVKGAEDKVDLTEADIIVSGGRGLQDPGNFNLIEELAKTIGGTVGASRAVVDAGWRPHSDQVGQTGKTVTPGLYIAAGISGAIQHLAGMSSSKCIVAINKDEDAPIFKIADYGIVGDLFEVVPALTEEFKKVLAKD